MDDENSKVIININRIYAVDLAAKVLNNIFNINTERECTAISRRNTTVDDSDHNYNRNKVVATVDTASLRDDILNYVSRVSPLLIDAAKNDFMQVWEDILALPEVTNRIYEHGKQQGTNFNRNLVANILFHLRHRKIYRVVYKNGYNGAALAEALEGDKESSVKHALRDDPPKEIRVAINKMMKEKHPQWP